MLIPWSFYRIGIRLTSPQLGTCSNSNIWMDHVLAKSKKMIAEANKMSLKLEKIQDKKTKTSKKSDDETARQLAKPLQKYAGAEISNEKEVSEIQGIVRRYQELLGKSEDIPSEPEELYAYARKLDEDFNELVKAGEAVKPTVFMRDKNGWPIISSHMFVGNLKENLKIEANNNTEGKLHSFAKSKVSVQEMITLDIRPIENYIIPSKDVEKDESGKPKILERPIRFDNGFGKQETAIALSEALPEGTEYHFDIRVRNNSPLNKIEVLEYLLELGKNNGLGQNRRSGFGRFEFQIKKLKEDPSKRTEGWQ